MEKIYDNNYNTIVEDILNNKEFNKIKYIEHHGITRYDHCLRVSYYSYKISKKLGFKYEEVARGSLLHDFFLSDTNRSIKYKLLSTFTHSKKALNKSLEYFSLSKLEQNIIKSHMFPINISIPRYKESFLVSTIDKVVAIYEFTLKFSSKFRYAINIFVLVLFGIFK